MPVVQYPLHDLKALVGASADEIIDAMETLGCEVEVVDNDVKVELSPNRPDMFCVEGLARAVRAILGIEEGMRKYDVEEGEIVIKLSEEVRDVRPYIVGAEIVGVKMSNELIQSLMNAQEKLHATIGRDRRKLAIGVHDISDVEPPFYYRAVPPSSYAFIPLGEDEEMTLEEILVRHEKGLKYAHILRGKKLYPILHDKNGTVLSFPPIINGVHTMVKEDTEHMFIDITGHDLYAMSVALNILVTALADRGGKILSVKIQGASEEIITPNLSPQTISVHPKYVHRISGLSLKKSDIVRYLKRMGHDAVDDGDEITVYIPRYRWDIMHPIDIVEEVTIAYGYNKIAPVLPTRSKFGSITPKTRFVRMCRRIMIGLGYQEVTTLTLTSWPTQYDLMRILRNPSTTAVSNPVSEEYCVLRTWLIPSLLKILGKNKHVDMPQKIFEIGYVVLNHKNEYRMGYTTTHSRSSFTEIKSTTEAIMRELGIRKYCVERKKHGSFILGRCASINVNGEEVAFFGEIHPEVLTNFDIDHPTAAGEINLEKIFKRLHAEK